MRRTLPGLILFLLMSAGAAWHAGRVSARLDRERDSRADASMRHELLKQDLPRDRRYSALVAAERLGYWVAAPKSPLEAMALGLSPAQSSGRPLTLAQGGDWRVDAGESALFLRGLHLDPALMLLLFFPIIVLWGPKLSFGLAAATALVVSLVSAAATLPAFGSPELWWRLGLWMLASVGAAWLWTGVRAWCDRHAEPERAALAAYVALALLVPGGLALLPGLVTPAPSAAAAVAEIRQATSARLLEDSARLGSFHEAHPDLIEEADTAIYDRLRASSLEHINRAVAPISARHEEARQLNRLVHDGVRLLSPVSALEGALLEAAGTSGGRAADFHQQVDRFAQGAWKTFFLGRAQDAAGFTQSDFAKVPPFRYEPEPVAAVLMRMALPLAAVGLFGFLFRVLKLNLPY